MTNFQSTQTEQQVHFLHSVAEASGEMSGSEIIERARFLGLIPFQPPYLAAIVYLDYSRLSYEEKDNTIQSVKGYISGQLRKLGYTAYCITDARNRVVCLFSLPQKSDIEAILNADLLRLYKKLQQRFGTEGFIGAGNLVWKPENISNSYCEAVEMLAYKYQYTNTNVLFASQIVKFQYAPALTNTHTFDKVVEFFLNANLGQFSGELDKLIEEVRHTPNVSNTSIKRTMAELIIHILHIASNWFPDSDRVLAGKDPYNWIMEQDNTPVIREWILSIVTQLLQIRQNCHTIQESQIVTLAKEHIAKNLRKSELSLQTTAEAQGISPTYLSAIFSGETGEGLCNYIVRLRMEQACRLLVDTDLKMSVIAAQIGLSSANYFTQVFRKTFGITPTEYRKKSVKA